MIPKTKLSTSLLALHHPVTKDAQDSFLKTLKEAFRREINLRPVTVLTDHHIASIIPTTRTRCFGDINKSKDPVSLARKYYMDGTLNLAVSRQLLSHRHIRTRKDLDFVVAFVEKAGMKPSADSGLSAKLVAKLLDQGRLEEATSIVEHQARHWLYMGRPAMLSVLIQYGALKWDINRAFGLFQEMIPRYGATGIVRQMLRESVRANDAVIGKRCLELDISSSAGQEIGLARWLTRHQEPYLAYQVLLRTHPMLVEEAKTGLEVARGMLRLNMTVEAQEVVRWIKGLFVISVQQELKEIEIEIDARLGEGLSSYTVAAQQVWATGGSINC